MFITQHKCIYANRLQLKKIFVFYLLTSESKITIGNLE